jgi:hypothetical protein
MVDISGREARKWGCQLDNRRCKPLKGWDQELGRRIGEKNVASITYRGKMASTWWFVLKMEAAGSSITSVNFYKTR